jgi:hypothetical protein
LFSAGASFFALVFFGSCNVMHKTNGKGRILDKQTLCSDLDFDLRLSLGGESMSSESSDSLLPPDFCCGRWDHQQRVLKTGRGRTSSTGTGTAPMDSVSFESFGIGSFLSETAPLD